MADQDGIWSVPHVLGALRAGRPEYKRVDEVPSAERKATPGAYGAKMITKKGVFGIVQGHQNRDLVIDSKTGALFVGVGSSGNLGVEPEPKATIQRFNAGQTRRRLLLVRVTQRRSHSIRKPVISTPWCKSEMASVICCHPTI